VDDPYNLAIVGAGLSALSALRAGVAHGRTVVLDYQDAPGGFLRSALPAPGFEDAWELISSFRLPQSVTAYFEATAVGLLPAFDADEPHNLLVRLRQGTIEIRAQRVLIACGGLEATREQAQIPGTRPAGVITPMLVHQLLARGYLPGRQAVVYGDARYVQVTAQRLTSAGTRVTLIEPATNETRQVEQGLPTEIAEIVGFPRLQCVRLRRDGQLFDVPADSLVYGVGMVANTHWLKGSGLITGPDGAIQVDEQYRTNVPGIYAVGTVVAPSLDHVHSITMGKEVASLLTGALP
jgi:thioredoxin reductase